MKKILTISIFTTLLALATLGFSHKAQADYYGSNYSNYNYGGYNNYNYVGGHAAANYAHQFYSIQQNQDNYYQTYYPPAPVTSYYNPPVYYNSPVYVPPAPVVYYNQPTYTYSNYYVPPTTYTYTNYYVPGPSYAYGW